MSDRTFDTATSPNANGTWGTINGKVITNDTIAVLVADVEAGFPDAILRPDCCPRDFGSSGSSR